MTTMQNAHDIPLVDDPNSLGIVYISGPMSLIGPPTWNFPAFEAKAAELRAQGYTVISPNEYDELNSDGGVVERSWDYFLRRDLVQLVKCGRIVMLPDWEKSSGACLEHYVAKALKMEVTYPA